VGDWEIKHRRRKMRRSRITFDIETVKVRTIVELLIDQVVNFSVSEIPNEANGAPIPKPRNTDWMKPAAVDITATMRAKPEKEWHYTEFDAIAKKRGYSPSVISQILSELYRAGRVQRVKRGHYKLVTM
jgi:predicted Rossmann fold nucleotide-binding protein DprA/Smf involved in DNA uptake